LIFSDSYGPRPRRLLSNGTADLFVPVWTDGTSLLFLNPRGTVGDDSAEEVNIGLGYRCLVSDLNLILGANLFKDLFAGIRDLVGGRSSTYERELQKARDIAMQELADRAAELGANAVVGIDIDYEVLGQANGMLMVAVSGTAVVL